MKTNPYLLLINVAIIFFISCINLMAQGGLEVSPGKLFFQQTQGEQKTEVINLKNPTSKDLEIQIHLEDWKRDSNGVKVYASANTLKGSCAAWLSISPERVLIPAQSEVQVMVKMNVPKDYSPQQGVKNTMIFLQQFKPYQAKAAVGTGVQTDVQVLFQVGVHVYYQHPGLKEKRLVLENMKQLDGRTLSVELQNTGECMLDAHIHFELTDLNNGTAIKTNFEPMVVPFLTGDYRRITIPIQEVVPAGKYTALVSVDVGASYDLEVGAMEILVK